MPPNLPELPGLAAALVAPLDTDGVLSGGEDLDRRLADAPIKPVTVSLAEAVWTRRARAVEVHDGDTLTLLLDEGHGNYAQLDARLKDTFAPELRDRGGAATRDFVAAWVARAASFAPNAEWPLVVTSVRTRTDRDARTFARYVYVVRDWSMASSLNEDVTAFVDRQGYPHGTGGGDQ